MEELRNCAEKFIFLDGYKFTLDEKTGYYRCNKIRQRLHKYIWVKYNSEVPKGYHVHHKDHNKVNNHIDNLEIVIASKHAEHHEQDKMKSVEYLEWKKKNFIENAKPKAIEWHKSEEGKQWHSKQAKENAKTRKLVSFVCEECSDKFQAWDTSTNRFCSNKCKSSWRRKSGIDNEVRKCEHCETEFETDKYSKKRFCSRSCSNRAIPRLPQYKK
jgi:hypothetical protein